MTPLAIGLIIALIVVVLAFAVYVVWKEWRSRHLRRRFGPEYGQTVVERGSRARAESQLAAREQRVAKFNIRPLTREEKMRAITNWQGIQAEFVDDPRKAVHRADALLGEVMAARGYPVTDFEQRAADLSVDHPLVVQHYRAGHAIALRHERGEAGTEELRQAMIHYRSLFDELVTETEPARASAQ
ncbi:MAG TPA: hypothetical protein VFW28_03360 [Micropepsaceae bacterium]|nr:hypothetical protein [Micropepsaceae bacterium]